MTQDPGSHDKQAAKGALSLNFGLGWSKSYSFHAGQTPVLRYNSQLLQAILHDRIPIADVVNAQVITLEEAPKGCADFDKGAPMIYSRPARHRSESGVTRSTSLKRTSEAKLGGAKRSVIAATHKRSPRVGGEQMSRGYAVSLTLIALITSGSVAAADQHIACNFSLPATAATRSDNRAMQAMTFFIDDANKQLVAEGGPVLSARTTSYSDTEVRADIKINSLPANEAAQITINRRQGTAVITVFLLPAGIDIETGDCHEVAAPQTQ